MRKFKHLLVGILLLAITGAYAQTKQVTGKVTDATGIPIPGATIKVRGAKGGTSAGSDGSFKLMVPENATLIITGIGYENKEIKSGSTTSFSIQLNQDTRALSEVVVTGVGTATTKKHLGIAVETIGASKLPASPTASVDQALVGKIPGAQISTTSGDPGAPVNILLRGINTIQGGTKPLILVDGIEVRATDIASLDLSNVDRVEVVQGAASATIYGAQGANGVIQIFTKKGKKGATAVNFFSSYASSSYINSGHVSKSKLHPYLTDANNNLIDYNTGLPLTYQADGTISGISYKYGGAARYGILDPRNINNTPYNANLKYYDQFKEVFQNGSSYNNGINVSGASDKSDYSIAVTNNHTITPVLKNGYADRTNFSVNLGSELFKGFKIRSVTQLIYTKNTIAPTLGGPGGYGYGAGNTKNGLNTGSSSGIYGFLNTSPFFDLKYKQADGTHPDYQVADFLSVNSTNPYYIQEYASGLDNKIDVIQNLDANYKVNSFVELDAKYGINYRTENSRWTYLNQSQNLNSNNYDSYVGYFNGTGNTGEIDNWQYNTTFQNFLASAYIRTDFQKDFHSKLPIQTSTQVAFDYRKNKYTEYDTYGNGLSLFPPINIGATSAQAVAEDYVEPFITYGYLVDQNINYGDFAGITGGFRSDFSSAFGAGSRAFTFPHINGYIAPSSFNFWNNSKLSDIVPYFKLRAGYGEAGIQPGPFQRYPTLSSGNIGQALDYSTSSTSANPNLGVEVSKEFEIGTDLSFGINPNGRLFKTIDGSFTYWSRSTKNSISTISSALSSGVTGILTNAIDLSSKGYQFQVNIPVYTSRDFNWNFTTNFSHETSIINKINGADIITGTAAGSTALVLRAGQKIGQLYGFKALTSTDEKDLSGNSYYTSATSGSVQKVDGRLVDTATKEIQFSKDAYSLGDPNPKFNMAFINTFTYKNFITFSFQFDWISGSHLYNQTKEWMYRDGINGDFDKAVTINGVTAAYTAYHASAYYGGGGAPHGPGNDATKDYFLESASFLRLRNINLGFDVARFLNIKAIKKFEIVFTGRNIITKTKYTGFDPEISSGGTNSAFDRGVDHNTTPNLKSYQAGINVGF